MQKDNYRYYHRNNSSDALERCFYKFIKQQGRNWNLGNIADIAVITGVSSGQRFTIYPCISSDIRI